MSWFWCAVAGASLYWGWRQRQSAESLRIACKHLSAQLKESRSECDGYRRFVREVSEWRRAKIERERGDESGAA